jgi:DNA-binding CsgD family transcriptional regulator
MKVRGISILTRKIIVTRKFGADAWRQLYRDVASGHPCFRALITAESLVPLSSHLALHDEMVRRLYQDDEPSHFELGRESARWALIDGPFKTFMATRDLAGFVASFPKLWPMYFTDTDSRSEATMKSDSVEFKVFDLPQWHPYFEHLVMGYMAEVLEMFCANPIAVTRLRGGGGRSYHYLLHTAVDTPHHRTEGGNRRGAGEVARAGAKYLSNREVDVLLLMAEGKTNEEIGIVLGISHKTAQHHVARAYRKIGVSNRASAVTWLAEQGLLGKRLDA